MPQILGLTNSDSGASYWSENARRKVFYLYPQGAAPLLGLLSMMDDEGTAHPEFGWHEERMEPFASTTKSANADGPFTNTSGTDLTVAGWSLSAGSSLRIYVNDYTQFRERDIVWVRNVLNTSNAKIQIKARVTAVNSGGYLTARLVTAVTNARNNTAQNGLDVFAVGSATGEGDRSRTGGHIRPIEPENYTQIFRTAFSLTGTALQLGLRYDSSGEYKNKAKFNGLRHSIMLERALWWGSRRKDTVTNDDGESVPERKFGGVEWFLQQYELGNTSNGAIVDYRPGGSDITASNWETEEDKRIIDVNGTLTKSQWNMLMERLFRKTGDEAFEKIGFCGSGFISAFAEFVDNGSVARRELFSNGRAGFDFVEWESPHGTIYLKSHPLFNEHSAFRNSCFFLDMGFLKYRYLNNRDTDIRKMIQANDADYRKDEWLTEAGFELRFPEAHMFIDNVTGIIA